MVNDVEIHITMYPSGGVKVLAQGTLTDSSNVQQETEKEKDITVLLADDNQDLSNVMEEYINQNTGMRVIGQARDGIQTIEMIKKYTPDVVVLDIIMPGIDGIGVLEKLQSSKPEKMPVFIVLSAIKQDLIVQKAMLMGAEYYLIKPFDMDILIRRIQEAYCEKENFAVFSKGTGIKGSNPEDEDRKIEIVVTGLIKSIGIPPHITGYQYLREAVIYLIKNLKYPVPVMKVIYPEVARIFSTTPQKVERAIRNAVDSTWYKHGANNSNTLFGTRQLKPTNSELIATIVEKAKTML